MSKFPRLFVPITMILLSACGGTRRTSGGGADAGPDQPGSGGQGGSGAAGGSGGSGGTGGAGGNGRLSCAVDVLFVIDDSSSMGQEQDNLARNFPVMMSALEMLPKGLPDVRIGVVSSNMGAGTTTENPRCPPGGEGGRLLSSARLPGCKPPTDHWISANRDGSKNNFSDTLGETFSCIATLGEDGCGFEQHLAALRASLDGSNPENAGFLREGAALAVVIITDEDDCSAPGDDTPLFDRLVGGCDTEPGPYGNYRCTHMGLVCDGGVPPLCGDGPLTGCHANDETGGLISVEGTADFVRGLKTAGEGVMVAVIAGAAEPVVVIGDKNPHLEPACNSVLGHALPNIRLRDFAAHFGARGLYQNLCTDDLSPVMNAIGELIRGSLSTAGGC